MAAAEAAKTTAEQFTTASNVAFKEGVEITARQLDGVKLLVELGLHYLREADLVAGPTVEEANA